MHRAGYGSSYSSPGERWAGAAASLAVVALIIWALLSGLSFVPRPNLRDALATVEFPLPPPSPTPSPRQPPSPPAPGPTSTIPDPARESAPEDKPSPPNLRNEATQIAAPRLPPLVLPPVIAAPRAGAGSAQSSGASDRPGPGQGAGGVGDGLGGGGAGGRGGSGGGGGLIPPRQTSGRLGYRDIPPELRRGSETSVEVQFRVGTDGRVSDCFETRSSGSAAIDDLVCSLIERRFRYEPSRDRAGRPVTSWVAETHGWYFPPEEEQ